MRPRMKKIKENIESEFEHKGFPCVVRVINLCLPKSVQKKMGSIINQQWRNGYVGVKKGHPFYRKHYPKINNLGVISVFGGLTFSGRGKNTGCLKKGYWWLGFDTMGSTMYYDNDTKVTKFWSKERLKEEVKKLAEQLIPKRLAAKVL